MLATPHVCDLSELLELPLSSEYRMYMTVKPNYGRGFEEKVFHTFKVVPFLLGSVLNTARLPGHIYAQGGKRRDPGPTQDGQGGYYAQDGSRRDLGPTHDCSDSKPSSMVTTHLRQPLYKSTTPPLPPGGAEYRWCCVGQSCRSFRFFELPT